VVSGVNGLLVPPGDHNALADAILSLSRIKIRSGKWGEGRAAAAGFSLDRMVKAHERLYDGLLQDNVKFDIKAPGSAPV